MIITNWSPIFLIGGLVLMLVLRSAWISRHFNNKWNYHYCKCGAPWVLLYEEDNGNKVFCCLTCGEEVVMTPTQWENRYNSKYIY